MGTSAQSTRVSAMAPNFVRAFVRRSTSRRFLQSFAVIVIAEAITIVVAWRLLDYNATRWIEQKTVEAVELSKQAAASGDWSRLDQIRTGKDSPLFQAYQDRLTSLTQRYFSKNGGSIYIVAVKNGEEFQVASNDSIPMDDMGKANPWEIAAYAQREVTHSPIPIVDDSGTYLAAYTPIKKSGTIIGLIAAEYDEAPISDFRSIIRSSFWFSILPAIAVSLVVAYILASIFVEPMDVLRAIEESAQTHSAQSSAEEEKWQRLTARQKEIAELLRQGVESYNDLAERLSVSPETIKQHLKDIKTRTGWSRVSLAVQAAGRRSANAANR